MPFDPNEKRDDEGKWTRGDGGSSSGVKFEGAWENHPSAKREVEGAIAALSADYDLPLRRVVLRDAEEFNQMVGKSKDTLYLSPRFVDGEQFSAWQREFKGILVDPTRAGVVNHEVGHMLDSGLGERDPEAFHALHDFVTEDVTYNVGGKSVTAQRWEVGTSDQPSAYATTSQFEFIAEAFGDWRENGENAKPWSQEVGRRLDVAWGASERPSPELIRSWLMGE